MGTDPVVTIERVGAGTLTEGAAVQFTVKAQPAPSADLKVNVGWSETGSTLASSRPGTVTIKAGATSATLTATTVDDQADEDPSRVTATVKSGTGYTLGSPSSATVAVNDNDDAPHPGQPEVTIEAVDSEVTEGTAVAFTVTATPAPQASLVVTWGGRRPATRWPRRGRRR